MIQFAPNKTSCIGEAQIIALATTSNGGQIIALIHDETQIIAMVTDNEAQISV